MSTVRPPDAVDAILKQWQVEKPELDLGPMGLIGRLGRCAALVRRRLDDTFAGFGLSGWEFDVLATLYRSGPPYCLAPTALFSTLMVTSGTMTHRLKGLEGRGWIERRANPDDARSLLVRLTTEGLRLIDAALVAHVDNEKRLMAPLAAADRQALDTLLARLLVVLEGEDGIG